jgi:hypothetical protein
MSNITTLLHQGIQHYQAGRLDEAAALFARARADAPDNADARHLLGLARSRMEMPASGVGLMRQAVVLDPGLSAAYVNLGNQMTRQDRSVDAIAYYRHGLALDPAQVVARDGLTLAFHKAVSDDWANAPLDGEAAVVLYQHNPGLGDNLLYSTLPELFAAQGRRVYISDQNRTRNSEIHDLVWGCNPYVSGVSTAPAKGGMAQLVQRFEAYTHIVNWLTRVEVVHGFSPTNDLPRIYYSPKPHPTLAGRIVIDVNSSTIKYPPEEMESFLQLTCLRFHYRREEMVQLRFAKAGVADPNASLPGVPSHTISSIFELCDALSSAKAFITVHSGANTLAAAIRGDGPAPMIHCAVDANHYNQKCYIWRNIDYTIVKSRS